MPFQQPGRNFESFKILPFPLPPLQGSKLRHHRSFYVLIILSSPEPDLDSVCRFRLCNREGVSPVAEVDVTPRQAVIRIAQPV